MKKILAQILAVGNYLNGGSARGQVCNTFIIIIIIILLNVFFNIAIRHMV